MTRMMRKNFTLNPGRVEGHGACGDCKPDVPRGRAAEKAAWSRESRAARLERS